MFSGRTPTRAIAGGISGGVFLIGLAIAFYSGHFLPVFFITLAITSLLGSLGSGNVNGLYGGLYGFLWLIIIALFFITGSWIWFLIGAGISAILGTMRGPILAAILGTGILGASSMMNSQPKPYYQPPQPEQPHTPYQQGYQPPQEATYQEGGQQRSYPSSQPQPQQPPAQYEEPQPQYPQETPPGQQQR